MPGGISAATAEVPTGRPGRPSVLTPDTVKRLKAALLGLNTLEDACRYARIHPATGSRWMQLGRKAKAGQYREFYETVQDAMATAKSLLVAKVAANARLDAKMALEVLSRRYPAEWARRQKVEVEDKTPGASKRHAVREKVVGTLDRIEARLTAAAVAAAADPEAEQ